MCVSGIPDTEYHSTLQRQRFCRTSLAVGAGGRERRQTTTEQGERWHADEVERFYTMLFSHPAVTAITWWDFADRNAWQSAPAGFL